MCKSLGYSGGVALEDCEFGLGTGHIWLDEVDCKGGEMEMAGGCNHNAWGDNDCTHFEDAGVICSGDYEPNDYNQHEGSGFWEWDQ